MPKEESGARINKARYWWAVLYPENMVPDWESKIGDIVQVPYAYAAHTLDQDGKSEHRKDHVHLILAFPNTTTYKHAMEIFGLLGDKAVNTCQAVIGIRHAYDYLIHDTESCRKAGKHLYEAECRHIGNGFDIGAYEQISTVEKLEMLDDMCNFVRDNNITNLSDAFFLIRREFDDFRYFEVFTSHNAMIDRICKGEYLKYQGKIRTYRADEKLDSCVSGTCQQHENESQQHENESQQHAPTCPFCDSPEVKKAGKTASGQQRYQCKQCGKTSTTMI